MASSDESAVASRRRLLPLAVLVVATTVMALTGCEPRSTKGEVVVYVSVDQSYAEPVLARFEKQTGIEVRAVYDVEAAKTTGLAQRILAERSRPQADVFWNGELVHTVELARAEALAVYRSPSAADLPDDVRDPAGRWAGCAGRVRVLVVSKDLPETEAPSSIADLVRSPVAPDQIGISHPLFGTSATHATALYATLGPEEALKLFTEVRRRGVRVTAGNSVVRDLVSRGQLRFGLTDTDDSCQAIKRGAPVRIVVPDQGPEQHGAMVIPTTVGLVEGGPHPQLGRQLVDYLSSERVERMLVAAGWSHAPVRELDISGPCFDLRQIKRMPIDATRLADVAPRARKELRDVFVR